MKQIIPILLLLHMFGCKAIDIDSVLTALSKAKAKNDTEKMYVLSTQAGLYYHEKLNYKQSLMFFEDARELANKKTDIAYCEKRIGKLFVDSSRFDLALKHSEIALAYYSEYDKKEEMPELYHLIGMCYGLSNNLDSAIISFNKGLKYNYELNDSSGMGLSYYNIGLAWYFKGQYDRAIENYIKSAEIRQNLPDTNALVASLISIGEIFRVKQEPENAKAYYSSALKLKPGITNKEKLAYLYSELALVNKIMKKYDSALNYIDTALTLCKQIKYKRGMATLANYKAGIFAETGDKSGALELYTQTVQHYKNIQFEPGIIQSCIKRAELYIDFKEFEKALFIVDSVYDMAVNNKLLEETSELLHLRYQIFKATGKYKQALKEHEQYMLVKDSLLNEAKESKISEIETKYQTAQKEKQISLLDTENKIKQQKLKTQAMIFIAVGGLFIFLLIIALLIMRQNKLKASLKIGENKQKLLRSQMNPHFIYNALSAIQNYVLQNNPVESVTYISEFSSLMRLVLEGSREDFIPLGDDIQLVSSYMTLQQLRLNNAFLFKMNVDENLDRELITLPPMLSQPFIENAIEHGMRKLEPGQGHIQVNYVRNNNALSIQIIDNGPGLSAQSGQNKKPHKSLATKITNERIETLKKTYNIAIQYKITSEPDKGTEVQFIIPLTNQVG